MTEARFPALRQAADLLSTLAVIVVGLIVLTGFVTAGVEFAAGRTGAAIAAALISALTGWFTWLLSMIAPELIRLLLAIEENTRVRISNE